MKKSYLFALLVSLALGCGPVGHLAAEPAGKGFRFPGGDTEAGRTAFISLSCVKCHTVANVELPDLKGNRRLDLTLGKEIRFVKDYEGLVTAITSPKHVVTEQYRAILTKAEVQGSIEPLMPDFTNDMSARQLMDIVAFLDEVYRKELPEYSAK